MCSTESSPGNPGTNNNNSNNTTPAPASPSERIMDSISPASTTISRNPNRRSNKPIMEKRRRARINNCLNELKAILLEAMKKDPARHSKLEKADILELTVSHLKNLHQNGLPNNNNSETYKKYRDGFSECAAEVSRFLSSPKADGISPITSRILMSHLSDCLNNVTNSMIVSNSSGSPVGESSSSSPPLLCHAGPPTPNCNNLSQSENHTTHNLLGISPNTPIHISLVPSRLASGEIAFVVPANTMIPGVTSHPQKILYSQHSHSPVSMSLLSPSSGDGPLELTVHSGNHPNSSCPTATSSPSSTTSSLSPVSYNPYHHHHQQHHHSYPNQQPPPPSHHPYYAQQQPQYSQYHSSPQPLSLVTNRYEDSPLDMSCWRPW